MGFNPIWGRYWRYRTVNPFWRNHHHLSRSLCSTSWYFGNPKWVWLHIHCVWQVPWYNTANSGNFGTSVFVSVCIFLCYAWREWVRWYITFCCWPGDRVMTRFSTVQQTKPMYEMYAYCWMCKGVVVLVDVSDFKSILLHARRSLFSCPNLGSQQRILHSLEYITSDISIWTPCAMLK